MRDKSAPEPEQSHLTSIKEAADWQELGEALRVRREELDITQAMLARETGYSSATIVNFEHGRMPDDKAFRALRKIALYLEVPEDCFPDFTEAGRRMCEAQDRAKEIAQREREDQASARARRKEESAAKLKRYKQGQEEYERALLRGEVEPKKKVHLSQSSIEALERKGRIK